MKRILFVSPTLGNGGAERVMLYLMNYFSAKSDQYDITLLLIKAKANDYLSEVSNRVNVVSLSMDDSRVRNCILHVARTIIRIHPDICFIGYAELNLALSVFLPIMKMFKIRFVVRETNILSMKFRRTRLIKWVYKYFYNCYDRVIVQSEDMCNDLLDNWGIMKNKVRLINNPVPIESIQERSLNSCPIQMDSNQYNFVIIGKFSPQKGYDILLKRLSEQIGKLSFHLYILGTGKLKKNISGWIDSLGLQNHVSLVGFQPNPYPFIKAADALILSSRYEGFPNVLLEANALGKPVFVNNCPGGINEIVKDGINGITANFHDAQDFSTKLQKFVMTVFDSEKICSLTHSRYSFERILPLYQQVIENL